MANKRMFSLSVVDTDSFLEMPLSSRLLYYELGMRADDDGFVANWKKILAFTGLKEDDLKVLIAKRYIIPFDSGVIVIRHWRMNNYLRNDRYKETQYKEELNKLTTDDNLVYQMDTNGIHSIDKNSIDKNRLIEKENIKEKERFKKPTLEEVAELGKSPMKDWKASVRTWERNKPKESNVPDWFGKEYITSTTKEDMEEMEELLNGL